MESMALDFHRIYILLDTGLLHFGLSNLLDFKAAWNAIIMLLYHHNEDSKNSEAEGVKTVRSDAANSTLAFIVV